MPTEHSILLNSALVSYTVRVSKKVKRLRVVISHGGGIIVTIPKNISQKSVEDFLIRKADWVLEKREYFKQLPVPLSNKENKEKYHGYKEEALLLVEKKIKEWNIFYGFTYHDIAIKNQKTRWGSCSRKGNLSFNYKIALLAPPLVDYIVVHELCHLGEFNHSPSFWKLVAQTIPDYKERRRELKKTGLTFL